MAKYEDILTELYSRQRKGVVLGLQRMQVALGQLGRPEARAVNVIVAGTNGKGSTSAFVESVAIASGLSVGVFSSPHLNRFTERFRVNGHEVSKQQLVAVAGPILKMGLTFFETCTLLAAKIFEQASVDLGVYEVGLGGRLDATNALDSSVAAVTSIGLDHQEWLGNTLTEIAEEKAAVFRGRVSVNGSRYHYVDNLAKQWGSSKINVIEQSDLETGLKGQHQRQNAATALGVCHALTRWFPRLSDEEVLRLGIASARLPGRWEVLQRSPLVVCDGAHNPSGALAVRDEIERRDLRPTLVVAGSKGKDHGAIASILSPVARRVIVTQAAHPRAEAAAEVAKSWRTCELAGNLAEAVQRIPVGPIVICGSLFLVGEARALFLDEPTDPLVVGEELRQGVIIP